MYKRYSQKAIREIRKALESEPIERIWSRQKAARAQLPSRDRKESTMSDHRRNGIHRRGQAALAWLENLGLANHGARSRHRPRYDRAQSALNYGASNSGATCARRPRTVQLGSFRRNAGRCLSQSWSTRKGRRWKPRNRAFHHMIVDGVTVEYHDFRRCGPWRTG